MTTYIKQIGMKRSGTNYTRWLLENNFQDVQVLSEVLLWKHSPKPPDNGNIDWSGGSWVDPAHSATERFAEKQKLLKMVTDDMRRAVETKELRYIVTVKSPYSWWCSYSKRFKERPERLMSVTQAIDLWNHFHYNWIQFCEHYKLATIVRYEDLLQSFDKTLHDINNELLIKANFPFVNNKVRMARRSDINIGMGQTGIPFDAQHYESHSYMEMFDRELIAQFKKRLSPLVMSELGYQIV